MKSTIIMGIIVLNIVLAVFLFTKDNCQTMQIQDENYILRTRVFYDYMKSIKYTGIQLDTNLEVTDNKDSVYLLKKMVNTSRKLIFRYSYISCNACVDTIMKIVDGFSEKVGKNKVIILSQYADKWDYKKFIRINNVKNTIYHLQDSLCRADEMSIPYFFVLDSDMITNNFYLPRQEYPGMVKKYLESIEKLLK